MENKKILVPVTAIAALLVGLFGGYLIWGHQTQQVPAISANTMHTMPDRTMMRNGSDMSSMMADMSASLQGKTGDAFDQEFLAEMVVHHQGAIDMANLALANAKHQEIKDLAKNIVTAQTGEIAEMKTWQKSWYGQ